MAKKRHSVMEGIGMILFASGIILALLWALWPALYLEYLASILLIWFIVVLAEIILFVSKGESIIMALYNFMNPE